MERNFIEKIGEIGFNRSPIVHYKNGELDIDMQYNNTKLLVVPDRFELSNVCYYDKDEDNDPIMFFDPELMQFLAGKGFQAIVADPKAIEYIEIYYARVESEKVEQEFRDWYE